MTDPDQEDMSNWRQKIADAIAATAGQPLARRALLMRVKARVAKWYFRHHPGAVDGELTLPVGGKSITIKRMEVTEVEPNVWALDVYVGEPESGDPHFRIFNPPLQLNRVNGLQSSPVEAVAEVIVRNGGALTSKRRITR